MNQEDVQMSESDAKKGRKKKPTYSDLIVLFFLYKGGTHCGYTMKKIIAETRIHEWLPISSMTVYQSMRRLANSEYISGEAEKNTAYPERIMYFITDSGRTYFDDFLVREMGTYSREYFHFDLGVGLSVFIDPKEKAKAVKSRIKQLTQRYDEVVADLDSNAKDESIFPRALLLDHEKSFLKSEIAWLRKYSRMIKDH